MWHHAHITWLLSTTLSVWPFQRSLWEMWNNSLMSLVTLFMTVGNTLMSVLSFRTFPADNEMLNWEKIWDCTSCGEGMFLCFAHRWSCVDPMFSVANCHLHCLLVVLLCHVFSAWWTQLSCSNHSTYTQRHPLWDSCCWFSGGCLCRLCTHNPSLCVGIHLCKWTRMWYRFVTALFNLNHTVWIPPLADAVTVVTACWSRARAEIFSTSHLNLFYI